MQTTEQRRAWLAKNREKTRAQRRARYAANREKELARCAEYRAKNPEKVRLASKLSQTPEKRRRDSRKRRGIINPPSDRPEGACEICGAVRLLDCDHDHSTGLVRGWLCRQCNTGLGHVERPEWLQKAQAYLGRS